MKLVMKMGFVFALMFFVMISLSAVFAAEKTAVIVVDMQGDFTTWKKGTLAVNGADEAYVKKVGDTTTLLKKNGFAIYGTQDWHPADHISFAINHAGKKPFEVIQVDGRTQVLWPAHCVQGTDGAKVLLESKMFQAIVKKGQNPKFDSYSGFQDDGGAKTEMDAILKAAGIKKLVVYGLATDYCVMATAIDAAANGYKVVVIEGLSRGVAPDTTAKALDNMRTKGILILKEADLQKINAL
ncbi:MAG: bifunctional nicotinamidase/pyrazinamidase [Proteobacteria bacterium]|nr:bifunctional nicotinamidase/pyrazinamidase [Pseudomonadota bacterium]